MNVKKIAIFASGSGTNAQAIMEYFAQRQNVKVDSLWSNNPTAFALKRAENMGVDSFVFNKNQFYASSFVVDQLLERKIDLIVLAGFLWLVPENLIAKFEIINIHPALLPKYGGKGMYGNKVHEAVVNNKELETGITIHRIDEKFDEGELIFQAKCAVDPNDTPEMVAQKVHILEHQHFPLVIEKYLLEKP
ncbi:MAG TPA: phosphoribosylglycinamide formyltransferase [Mariniphaga sp.]|nr:phosphoribosylglycinamide formyltransferase [Mariniphaga sp.]